jgi:hypothetical protein
MKMLLAVVILCIPVMAAGGKRDPLNNEEIDQLRETAMEPEKRIRLYVKFERARLLAIDQTRSDPKLAQGRGERLHDLIEDVMTLNDELDDNLDEYAGRKADLRKVLKEVIQAETEFQLKLRGLKEASSDPKLAAEAKDYEFVLENATEAVAQSLENDRKMLDEQNEQFAKKKEEKKKS